MGLTFRMCRDEDLPDLEQLWRGSTEWGSFTADMFRKYFTDAPCGGPLISLAINDETRQIVGQAPLLPTRVRVRGQDLLAFRPAAPILAPELRATALDIFNHPVLRMYRHAAGAMKERGGVLTYSLPDPHWKLLLRLLPGVSMTKFPLWSLRLPLERPFRLDSHYEASEWTEFDERVDRLWEKFSAGFECLVARDARSLRLKAPAREYELLGVERGGELVGLVASRRKGDRQWLVCDLLAADADALRATLMAVSNLAHERSLAAGPGKTLVKVGVLAVPAFQPVLGELGFGRDKYDFHFVVRVLSDSITAEDVAPSRWYVSAND